MKIKKGQHYAVTIVKANQDPLTVKGVEITDVIISPPLELEGNEYRAEQIGLTAIKGDWKGRTGSVIVITTKGLQDPNEWYLWEEVPYED